MDMGCSKSKNQIHSGSLKQLKVQANFIVVGDDFSALGCAVVEKQAVVEEIWVSE